MAWTGSLKEGRQSIMKVTDHCLTIKAQEQLCKTKTTWISHATYKRTKKMGYQDSEIGTLISYFTFSWDDTIQLRHTNLCKDQRCCTVYLPCKLLSWVGRLGVQVRPTSGELLPVW